MFGRRVRLTLNDGTEHVYTDLDVRFTVRNNCNFINDARIELLNPKRDILDAFTSNVVMYKESFDKRKVKLEIGWADENTMTCIFDGVVMTAMPSSYPPDIWLSMTCIGYAYAYRSIPLSEGNTGTRIIINPTDVNGSLTFSSVIGKLNDYVGKIGYAIQSEVGDDINQKTVKSFQCGLKIRDMMQSIKAIDENIEVFDYTDQSNGKKTIAIKDRRKDGRTVPEITKDNGMVGIPRCNWPNYYIETLLRTDIHLWDTVTVKSQFKVFYKRTKDSEGKVVGSTDFTGTFRVMGITYTGQLRSGKWSMSLDLLQIDYAEIDKTAERKQKTDVSNVKVK